MNTKYSIGLLSSIVFLQMFAYSCSGGDDSKKEEDTTETGEKDGISRSNYEGRGTEACQDWQFAYCEYAYETCDFGIEGNMNICMRQYASFSCLSDDNASSCAEALKSAGCTSVPQLCMYENLVDPAPAIEQCNEYIDAICERDVGCGGGTIEECREEYIPLIACDEVIGTYLNFEECLPQLRELGCTEMVPEECETLFLAS